MYLKVLEFDFCLQTFSSTDDLNSLELGRQSLLFLEDSTVESKIVFLLLCDFSYSKMKVDGVNSSYLVKVSRVKVSLFVHLDIFTSGWGLWRKLPGIHYLKFLLFST